MRACYNAFSLLTICLLSASPLELKAQVGFTPFPAQPTNASLEPPAVNPLQLIAINGVRQELQLGPEQVQRIQQVAIQLMQRRSQPRTVTNTGNVLDNFIADTQKLTAGEMQFVNQQFAEVLTKEQSQRLQQLVLQFQGVDALATRKMVDTLQLSANQQEAIERLRRDIFQQRVRELQRWQLAPGGAAPGNERLRAFLQELDGATERRLLGVLTPAQSQQFNELRGEKFEGFVALPRASVTR